MLKNSKIYLYMFEMKKSLILLSVFISIISSKSFADDTDAIVNSAVDRFTSKIGSAVENLLGGEGDTEVKFSAGQDLKPTFSIMTVKPLSPHNDNSGLFVQLQLNNLQVRDDDRFSMSVGLGERKLSADKSTITGANAFIDYDEEGNARASAGLEFKKSAFEANVNAYGSLSGSEAVGTYTERVLSGFDISLVGEVPYLPWANIIYNHYEWDAVKNITDSRGNKLSAEMLITPNLVVEAGKDDNSIDGLNGFARVIFVFPPREGISASSNLVGDTMFTSGDISNEMLSKVRRTNAMVIESESSGVTIARASE